MAVRAYSGSARPIDDRYENDPAYRKVEYDDPDGSIYRGYEHIATRRLVSGACVTVSASRLATLNATNTAEATRKAGDAAFIQSIRDGIAAVRALPNTPERQLLIRTARLALGLFRDND